MRYLRYQFVAAALLAGLLLAGCGAAAGEAAGGAGLGGTRWELASVGGSAVQQAGEPLTLEFDEAGQASGNGGCNRYSGSYSQGGSALSFGPMVSTKRACADDALNAQEAAFLSAMGSVAGYRVSGGALELLDASGAVVLSFSRA
jgi:heat shock protein HslJ